MSDKQRWHNTNELLRKVANQSQELPIISIQHARCASNQIYEVINHYEEEYSRQELSRAKTTRFAEIEMNSLKFVASVYNTTSSNGKISQMKFIRSCILMPDWLATNHFTTTELSTIVKSASLHSLILMKVTRPKLISDLPFPFYFVICAKVRTNRTAIKTTNLGLKLDCQMLISQSIWNETPFQQKIGIFALCDDLLQNIKKMKIWSHMSTTKAGFYYSCQYSLSEDTIYLKSTKIQLSPCDYPIKIEGQKVRSFEVGIDYDPGRRKIKTIEKWRKSKEIEAKEGRLWIPIANKMYLISLTQSLTSGIKRNYLNWIKQSDSRVRHEILRNPSGHIIRIKSYLHKSYWYPSAD